MKRHGQSQQEFLNTLARYFSVMTNLSVKHSMRPENELATVFGGAYNYVETERFYVVNDKVPNERVGGRS